MLSVSSLALCINVSRFQCRAFAWIGRNWRVNFHKCRCRLCAKSLSMPVLFVSCACNQIYTYIHLRRVSSVWSRLVVASLVWRHMKTPPPPWNLILKRHLERLWICYWSLYKVSSELSMVVGCDNFLNELLFGVKYQIHEWPVAHQDLTSFSTHCVLCSFSPLALRERMHNLSEEL